MGNLLRSIIAFDCAMENRLGRLEKAVIRYIAGSLSAMEALWYNLVSLFKVALGRTCGQKGLYFCCMSLVVLALVLREEETRREYSIINVFL